jgi:hypothetical protein
MAKWLFSVLVVIAPWLKSMTVLAVVNPGSGNCSGRLVDVPARETSVLLPPNFSRDDLKAVRTPPLMLALITSIQASTAFRLWMVETSAATSPHVAIGGILAPSKGMHLGTNLGFMAI